MVLVEFCKNRVATYLGRQPASLSSEVMEILHAYDWPGNVLVLEGHGPAAPSSSPAVSAAPFQSRCGAIGCPAPLQSAARSVLQPGSRPQTRGVIPRAGLAPWRVRPVQTVIAPGHVLPHVPARCRDRGWSAVVAIPIAQTG